MFKYNEDKQIQVALEYIKTTYKAHYVGNSIQVNDLIMSIGHGEGSYIANAIEYLCRYGKKEGKNPKDLHKAIHNILLLLYLNHSNIVTEESVVVTEAKKEESVYNNWLDDSDIYDDEEDQF